MPQFIRMREITSLRLFTGEEIAYSEAYLEFERGEIVWIGDTKFAIRGIKKHLFADCATAQTIYELEEIE